MGSSKAYFSYILDQLSEAEAVSWRAMMGEYILYCQGKVVGGVYDDRLLVKPTPAALRLLPDALREPPYAGGKEMLLVEELDDRAFLARLLAEIASELPQPKAKGKQK